MIRTTLITLIALGCSAKPEIGSAEGEASTSASVSGSDFHEGSPNAEVAEICDGEDNDGDGLVDEGLLITFYTDADEDGWGSEPVEACTAPPGTVTQDGDCQDDDPTIHPDAEEVCNELDDDCDLAIDEGLAQTFFIDADGDGYGSPAEAVTACSMPEGYADNSTDCDDTASTVSPEATELCDAVDNNCDGRTDEGVGTLLYPDADGDGFGVRSEGIMACWDMVSYTESPGDCDDGDPDVNPDAPEICDEIDNDCDALIDEYAVSGLLEFWGDLDGDGHGAGAPITACSAPEGFVSTGDDCDDTDASRSPSLTEACNGFDDDCDGVVDEGVLETFFIDADSDGYGAGAAVFACSAVPGTSSSSTDCDDTRADVYPDAPEVCDGVDNDCNVVVDDEPVDGITYYADIDGDGYGDPLAEMTSCSAPLGHVVTYTDCDPGRADVYPGAPETCDGRDNDCDGTVDDDPLDAPMWYLDADGDGFGDPLTTGIESCEPVESRVLESGDCNDDNADIYPTADEYCNDTDDDCDGEIDEEAVDMYLFFADDDGDGYGSEETIFACEEDDGWTYEAGDCDDDDDGIYPYATETCDAVDEDCDGVIDNDADDCDCTQENYGSNSYMFCERNKKWNDAKNYCRSRDYDLVSISSWGEQNFLLDEIRYSGSISNTSYWIGLNDRSGERGYSRSGWTWVSGDTYSYEAWSDWPYYQPDDAYGEDCVEINRWTTNPVGSDWNDLDCNDRIYFVCEASL